MDPLRPLCLYHRNCLDGLAAAAVVRRWRPEVELRGLTYGQGRRPTVLGREVFLVDLALPEEDLRALAQEATSLVWIDHHPGSRELAVRLGWGVIDEQESAATLAWRHLFPHEPLPEVLRHVRERDLWTWQLPDGRAIAAGLEDRFFGPEVDGLLEADLDDMRRLGEPLLIRTARIVERIVRRGRVTRDPYGLRGSRALLVNTASHLNEVGERTYLDADAGGLGLDLAILFSMRGDGRWVHCLRSRQLDCRRIAEVRGGGGHAQAASYIADEPFPLSQDCLD